METKNNKQQINSQNRPDKFDLQPGDLKFFKTKAELEQYYKDKHPQRKIVWN